ncbi:MAG: tRNA (N(6)-L-threonylcarbamoyladenosine(37)-C(2))-methylthiotransferase MtaB [Bacteroidota bacterium]
MNKKIAYYALGCKLNFAEASAIAATFKPKGYDLTTFNKKADVYLINTCTVTEKANSKSRNAIQRAIRRNPGAIIIVTGCYAQLKSEELAKIKGVDYIIGTSNKTEIARMIDTLQKQNAPNIIHTPIRKSVDMLPAWSSGERTRSFLKIQDGCDNFCSYCTIPLARGKSRNLPISNIVTQAEEIARNGFKEIILTGVNIADFGKSTDEHFLDLLQALGKVKGIERYRISSTEPDLLHDEIVDFVLDHPHFMPHFHIPLQSGSDAMLKIMNRKYDTAFFADRIHYIKQKNKDAFIGVDVIVGVSGETDKYFRESLQFAASLDISFLHVFTFSERPNTKILDRKPVVPAAEKKSRSKAMHQLSDKKIKSFYHTQLGNTRPVLFESSIHNNQIHGFTDNYLRVAVPENNKLLNQIKHVHLEKINNNGIFSK